MLEVEATHRALGLCRPWIRPAAGVAARLRSPHYRVSPTYAWLINNFAAEMTDLISDEDAFCTDPAEVAEWASDVGHTDGSIDVIWLAPGYGVHLAAYRGVGESSWRVGYLDGFDVVGPVHESFDRWASFMVARLWCNRVYGPESVEFVTAETVERHVASMRNPGGYWEHGQACDTQRVFIAGAELEQATDVLTGRDSWVYHQRRTEVGKTSTPSRASMASTFGERTGVLFRWR